MKTAIISSTILFAAIVSTMQVSAQDYPHSRPVRSPHYYQHHASTVYEGWLRGRADLWRALGEYKYNSALANRHNEEAYSRALDNSKKHVETFFQRRAINRDARNAERRPRPTPEAMARNAQQAAPKRLDAYQYERALGSVTWPAVLQDDVFQSSREVVDELIARRTSGNSGEGTNNHRLIKHVTTQMKQQLKDRIDDLSPSEYVNAKKFLTSLEYESRHRLDAAGLAAN